MPGARAVHLVAGRRVAGLLGGTRSVPALCSCLRPVTFPDLTHSPPEAGGKQVLTHVCFWRAQRQAPRVVKDCRWKVEGTVHPRGHTPA